MELDDLVYSILPQNFPGLQTVISRKAEFIELASRPTESIPTRGSYFNHQKLVARLMLFYKRMLLIHSTGTGKSCAATATSEQFKEKFIDSLASFVDSYVTPKRTHIRKVYILVRGETLADNIRDLIVCTCTKKGTYETAAVENAASLAAARSVIQRNISEHYVIKPYGQFVNKYLRGRSTDELRAQFDNTLFIIDEAHTLRVDVSSAGDTDEVIRSGETRDKTVGSLSVRDTEKKKGKEAYTELSRLFRVSNCSVLLMTATPMVNVPTEIAPLMNLINDGTYPMMPDATGEDSMYYNPKIEEMEKYFRGRVSYVSQLNTGAQAHYANSIVMNKEGKEVELEDICVKIPDTSVKGGPPIDLKFSAVSAVLGEEHTEYYRHIEESGIGSFRIPERHAMTFMFKDPETGKLYHNHKVGYDTLFPGGKATNKMMEAMRDVDKQWELSAKFTMMLNEIMDSVREGEGTCFVFFPFISGAGIEVFSQFLIANGLQLFDEDRSIFIDVDERRGARRNSGYCDSLRGAAKGRSVKEEFIPRQDVVRFCTYTKNTKSSNAEVMLKTFNSSENMNGEIIKVFIGSPVTGEGISLFHGTRVMLPYPLWNRSTEFQAISRMLRSTSHVELMAKKRQNMLPGDPEPTVEVRIIKYMGIPNDFNPHEDTGDRSGVDYHMLLHNKKKEIYTDRMESILRRCAIDCLTHKARNYHGMEGENICLDEVIPPDNVSEGIDTSTKLLLFSEDIIQDTVDKIIAIMRYSFSLSFVDLKTMLEIDDDYMEKVLLFAIERLIIDKMTVRDPFGRKGYLLFDGTMVFIARNPENTLFLDAFYSRNVLITADHSQEDIIRNGIMDMKKKAIIELKISFGNFLNGLMSNVKPVDIDTMLMSGIGTSRKKDLQLWQPAEDSPYTYEGLARYLYGVTEEEDLILARGDINNTLNKLPPEVKGQLVEEAIVRRQGGMIIEPFDSYVLDYFQNKIHVVTRAPESVAAVQPARRMIRRRARTKVDESETVKVYLHELLHTTKVPRLREYVGNSGTWKDTIRDNRNKNIDDKGLNIAKLKDAAVYAVDVEGEIYIVLNKQKDVIGRSKRGISKGIPIGELAPYELLMMLRYLRVPHGEIDTKEKDPSIVIRSFMGKWGLGDRTDVHKLKLYDLNKLHYMNSWSTGIGDISSIVIDALRDRGLVADSSGKTMI